MEKVKLELNFSQMLQFMNSSLYTDYLVYQLYILNSFFSCKCAILREYCDM